MIWSKKMILQDLSTESLAVSYAVTNTTERKAGCDWRNYDLVTLKMGVELDEGIPYAVETSISINEIKQSNLSYSEIIDKLVDEMTVDITRFLVKKMGIDDIYKRHFYAIFGDDNYD